MFKDKKAVSLRYPSTAQAPFITATGKNLVAEKILKIAKENGIFIVENKELTDVLFLESPGNLIPESVYEAVAKVFCFIQAIEEKEQNYD
ncbi:EscU/YscU/HrcU family type III secretion system export apparatus switch protein [Treponema pectinovorum]|uniref:EscU/YscU/HrcU family type III secretion system export apparatus switch protein n=1 Tax=Treponema pectinovorum TaxID=164 RepID=UPI0011CCA028|nr:EscU/YscU/HrcU family type III secretion system export apparatus switch protein [Treponema pectinovorum]